MVNVESGIVERDEQCRGRTLLDLRKREDGTWVATQHDIRVEGCGETAALAAMDYCRRIAEGQHEQRQ